MLVSWFVIIFRSPLSVLGTKPFQINSHSFPPKIFKSENISLGVDIRQMWYIRLLRENIRDTDHYPLLVNHLRLIFKGHSKQVISFQDPRSSKQIINIKFQCISSSWYYQPEKEILAGERRGGGNANWC